MRQDMYKHMLSKGCAGGNWHASIECTMTFRMHSLKGLTFVHRPSYAQKLRWRLLSLPIACVSSHRLHVMFMMLHLRLHSCSHVASEVHSGYYNNLLFASISAAMTLCMKRGAHLAVHRADGQMHVMCS